jgi:pimeloyl-ACP methyl ester carboxylesterase
MEKIFLRVVKSVSLGVLIIGITAGMLYLVLPLEKKDLDQKARENAEGSFRELSDGVVHFEIQGDPEDPLVVLIHGFSVPYYVWDPTAAGLAESGFQVLRYDLYGRGYSDRPETSYDLDLFVRQLDELIQETESPLPVHIVGLSMGGPIAARYAVLHPEQVRSVTLIAPEVLDTDPEDILPMNIPGVGEYFMHVILAPVLLPRLQAADFYQPERFPEWESLYREQLQFHGTSRALLSTIRELVDLHPIQIYGELKETSLPVLIIRGEFDETITPEALSAIRHVLPEADFLPVPKAGHLPHYEQPDMVNADLIAFMEKTGP